MYLTKVFYAKVHFTKIILVPSFYWKRIVLKEICIEQQFLFKNFLSAEIVVYTYFIGPTSIIELHFFLPNGE